MNTLFARRVDLARDIYQRISELEQCMRHGVVVYYIHDTSSLRLSLGVAHLIGPGLYIHEGALCRIRHLFPCICIEEVSLETEPIASLVNLHSTLCRS